MKLEERLQKGSVFRLTRVACVLALIGLVMMVYSILSPRPLPVILAMSVGQMFGMAAVACYLLAIRTKEFAIGLVFLLLLMNMIAERQRVRATLQQLLPYLIVFGVYAVWYSRLVLVAPVPGIDPYALNFSIPTVVASLGFQVSTAFYERIIGVTGVMLVIVGLGVGLAAASADARRIALFGIAALGISSFR